MNPANKTFFSVYSSIACWWWEQRTSISEAMTSGQILHVLPRCGWTSPPASCSSRGSWSQQYSGSAWRPALLSERHTCVSMQHYHQIQIPCHPVNTTQRLLNTSADMSRWFISKRRWKCLCDIYLWVSHFTHGWLLAEVILWHFECKPEQNCSLCSSKVLTVTMATISSITAL